MPSNPSSFTRRLSKLQLNILKLAATNRASGKRSAAAGDVTTCELLGTLFGWQSHSGRVNYHYQNFDPGQVGDQVYRSAYSSISRSLRRLEQRGLAIRERREFMDSANIVLTEAGYEIGAIGSDLPPWSRVAVEVNRVERAKRLAELEGA